MQDGSGVRVVALTRELEVGSVAASRAELAEVLNTGQEGVSRSVGSRTIDPASIREPFRAQAVAARDGDTFGTGAAAANVRRLLDAADAAGLVLVGDSGIRASATIERRGLRN